MALPSFIFGGDTGETPQSLEAKRAIAQALAYRAMSSSPRNVGEGLTAIGRALAYRGAMSDFMGAESAAQKDYASSLGSILGGAPAMPAVPASGNQPAQPQIPAAAVSGGDLTNTPQPLSGGTMAQNSPSLADAVAKLESGGSPVNGPAQGYANYRYQQFPAFVKQYGAGEDGVTNYARQVLAANPNATFGDMYGGYVTGTGNPGAARMASLQTTTQPGAQGAYANLMRNSPIDPNTPLAQLVGNSQVASNDPNFVPSQGAFSSPQLAALLSPSTTITPSSQALAFNGQPSSANPLANPQAFAKQGGAAPQPVGQGIFAPPSGAQPNVTNLQTQPAQLPIEGQNPGRAAVVQALQGQNQPQAAPTAASGIPPQVAETIRRLSMNPLPQAQQLASTLMQQYMRPHQYGFQTLPDGTVVRTDPLTGTIAPVYQSQTPYQLMPQADGTVMAVNPRNPNDHYVAFKGAAKPIAVQPGATLVVPGATGQPGQGGPAPASAPGQASSASPSSPGGFQTVYQNQTGLFDKNTLTSMADQYLAGDKSVLQNLGRTAIGGMNMTALRERIVSRAHELGISPTEVASRIGQFDSYTAAQKATGTRGGNVTMAATEAGNLGKLVLDTSADVPRTNYPIWNKVTNAYAENTGDPNIVKFTGALNSYINAYARAINPSGSTTVSDKEHAREILDTAMAHGQIQAGVSQLQAELDQAKRAPASSSETIKNEFMNRANPKNSEALTQARDAIAKGANKAAVIQRLQSMGIDPSGL